MASSMTAISLVLMSAVTVNALNMRSSQNTAHRRRWNPTMATPQNPATWKFESPLDEPTACPPGWVFFLHTGNCYKLFTSKTKDARRPFTAGAVTVLSPATYDAAASTCRNNNPSSYIAVPNSITENTFLRTDIYDPSKYAPLHYNDTADPWDAAVSTWLGFDWCGNGKTITTQLQSCATGQKKWGNGWSDGSGTWADGTFWRNKTVAMGGGSISPNIKPALAMTNSDGAWQFVDKNAVKRPFICEMKYTKRQLNSPHQPTPTPGQVPMVKAPDQGTPPGLDR